MKTLSQLKMILIILTIGLLSCKNNKDGYSDEIDTTKASTDTASAARPKTGTDTNATSTSDTEPKGVTGAGSISSPEKPANRQTTTANNGTGPGPSAKDGSVYDISSQTKKDTTKLGSKAKAKASKEKKANKK
ncbi:hypothetical protein EV144_101810 [Flavobacterium sp. 270]|uniref:hypothetical protein n=1 Tax=Flavobacterium sp. 270 TaxID=2512114 RepID=UPI00106608A7|nr:hypothetical protein [Flavobacterium sp. 270]TDW52126.1 hypothetical protein EV144_101810 [Flavobacterium sp. 270]